MQYVFDHSVSQSDKLYLKEITSNFTVTTNFTTTTNFTLPPKVGIYFSNETIKITNVIHITNYINEKAFEQYFGKKHPSEPHYIFSVSSEIFNISKHLGLIIKFIVNRNFLCSKLFHIAVEGINHFNDFSHCRVLIFPEIMQHKIEYRIDEDKSLYTCEKIDKSVIVYEIIIEHDKITKMHKCNAQWVGANLEDDLKHYSPYNLVVSMEYSECLLDQYFTLVNDTLKNHTEVVQDTKTKDKNFEHIIKPYMQVKVTKNNTQIFVNCSKCPDFHTLSKYLTKKFGKGTCIVDIDFETMEEVINYNVTK